MKKRKLFPLLFTMLIIFVLGFSGELKVFAKEPTPQPGTNSYKGTSGSYNRIGFSMLIDGYNYTTSIGDNDAAYVSSSDTTNPLYPNEFQVVLENGARYIRGSVRVKMADGSTKYMNYNIVLHPKNFNPNSAVIGRSLLDNIFLESGVNKTTLANKLSQGNTVAWINAIISIRTPSGARSTHAEIKQNRLWYQGKDNYTSYPDRVYSTSAIKNALPWSTQTLNAFNSMFNNKYTLPAIYEVDRTAPSGTFSPNSKSWTNSNVSVTFTPSDSGSGVKQFRYRISTDNGSTYGSWSSWYTTSSQTISLTSQGRIKIQAEVHDKAGNTATITSGTYYIDKTAPTATFSPNSSNWTNQKVVTVITPSDSLSGVKRMRWNYSMNNGKTWGTWSDWIEGSSPYSLSITVDGERKIKVEVEDNAGNKKEIESGTFYIDMTAPEGTLTASPTSWTNGNVVITATGSDSGGSGFYRIKRPDGTYVNGTTATYTATSNGTYTFYFYDKAGNETAKSITISNIDKSSPTVTFSPKNSNWTNKDINVVITPSDVGSGVKRMRWRTSADDGGTYGSWSSWIEGSSAYTLALTTEGRRKIQIEVEDNAGNTEIITSETYYIDKTNPSGTLSLNSTNWTNGSVTINAAGSDSLSGIDKIKKPDGTYATGSSTTYTVNTNGTYSFVFYDKAGNETIKSITVSNIDKTAPTGTLSANPTTWTNGNVVITASGSDSGGSGFYRIKKPDGTFAESTSTTYTVTSNGTYTFYFYDRAGNETVKSITISNIDTTLPNATFSPNSSDWTNKDISVVITSSDSGSGIKRMRIRTSLNNGSTYGNWSDWITNSNYTLTITGQGQWKIQVEIEDNAGNTTTKTSGSYNIDKTNPIGTLKIEPSTWANGNVTITAEGSDTGGSGFYRIKKPDGTYVTGNKATYTVSTNGTYTFEFYDNAGNSTTKTVNVTNIDKTAPTGTLTPSTTNWTNKDIVITATGSDAESGISKIEKPDGTFEQGSSTTYTVSENGTYTFVFYDNAGNKTSKSITINNIDKIAPIGTLSANPTTWTKGEVVITATGSDTDSGMYRIKKPDGTYATGSSTTYTVSKNGDYTFIFYDNAGNYTEKTIKISNIDKDNPSGTFSPNSSNWTKENIAVTFTPTDNGSGVYRWRYRISTDNGTTYGNWSSYIEGGKASTITLSASGKNKIQVEIVDNAGNSTIITSGVYQIDKENPSAVFAPNSQAEWTNNNISVNVKVSDTLSGVKRWRWRISKDNGSTYDSWRSYITNPESTVVLDTEGRIKIQIEAEDNAGNVVTITSGTYLIDKTVPTGKEYNIGGDLYFDGTVYWIKQNGRANIKIRANDKLSLLESMILQLQSNTDSYRQNFNFTNNQSQVVKESNEIEFVSGAKTYESADKTDREVTFSVKPKIHGKEYSVYVYLKDYAGNIRNFYDTGLKFKVDGNAPILTVTKNPSGLTNGNVVLNAKASDADSGIKKIILPDGTEIAKDTAQFTVTKNGNYTFIAEDNLGHRTTVVVSVTNIDKTKPINASIVINNDDEFTNRQNVTLTLYAEDDNGVAHMRFRTNDGTWSSWIPYATSYDYIMASGYVRQGTNYVYVQFKDEAGNISEEAYDSIVLDSIAPIGGIEYDKSVVNTRNINLTISAYDVNPEQADIISGLDSVRFRELQNGVVKQDWTPWEKYQPVKNWTLSFGDGEKVIEMEIRDKAGNVARVSKTIILDTLFIEEAVFTNIVSPPPGNPELPTAEVVKVKKGRDFTFQVKTIGNPDEAIYSFNGEVGKMDKIGDNLFEKTLRVPIDDETSGILPIYITVKRHSDNASKSTTLQVWIVLYIEDYDINLTN